MKRYLDQKLRLQLLRVVDALESHGSLLKASAALGVSQPALTKSLKDIEDLVGTRLFERHARGVTPTESGMVLVRSGRRILAELKRTEEDLDHLTNPFGGIAAIGGLPVSASGILPLALLKLRETNPDFRVRLEEGRTEELMPLLAAGQIDLIVGRFYEPATPDNCVRDELWRDPMAIVARAGHPLFDLQAVTVADLMAFELVLPVAPQRVAAEIEAIIEPLGLSTAPAIRSTSYGFTREILLSTDAFTVMPPTVVLGDLNRGALRARPLPVAAPTRAAGIITVRGRSLNGASQAFIDCLKTNIGDILDACLASAGSSPALSQARGEPDQQARS